MFKRREMRLNGEWSLLAGNRVYELILLKSILIQQNWIDIFNGLFISVKLLFKRTIWRIYDEELTGVHYASRMMSFKLKFWNWKICWWEILLSQLHPNLPRPKNSTIMMKDSHQVKSDNSLRSYNYENKFSHDFKFLILFGAQ